MTTTPAPAVLSRQQRRCHLLLMLLLPDQTLTPETLGSLNGVDSETARQDVADTHQEIQAYHRLVIRTRPDGSYHIRGSVLDQHLCLFHWLRRALRLSPTFVACKVVPVLQHWLKQQGLSRSCYDETNLHALVSLCARRLNRTFNERDSDFLRVWLLFSLYHHFAAHLPQFNLVQINWISETPELIAAQEITCHWSRRLARAFSDDQQRFLAFLFSLLRIPDPDHDAHHRDIRLHIGISQMIADFRDHTGMVFSDEGGLHHQLYSHISQAMNRVILQIGIDNNLPDEMIRLYPRLTRTTERVLARFSADYNVYFSSQEIGLIAVIFGAWLVQEGELHEKQVVLLTSDDPQKEQHVEQQIRELTLLPLNIKYLTLNTFQQVGVQGSVDLIISPYETRLPLFSPPLIHAALPLAGHQQQRIREILESQ